jgi:hypothetical protein
VDRVEDDPARVEPDRHAGLALALILRAYVAVETGMIGVISGKSVQVLDGAPANELRLTANADIPRSVLRINDEQAKWSAPEVLRGW